MSPQGKFRREAPKFPPNPLISNEDKQEGGGEAPKFPPNPLISNEDKQEGGCAASNPKFEPKTHEFSISLDDAGGGAPTLYVDGYLKTNYPSFDCIACSGATEDNILGFRLNAPRGSVNNMIDLAKSIILAIGNSSLYPLKHEYVVENTFGSFDDIYLFFKSSARRREIIRRAGGASAP